MRKVTQREAKRVVPCRCGAYWFPHRAGSHPAGHCALNRDGSIKEMIEMPGIDLPF